MSLVITKPVTELADTTNATSYALAAFTPTANSLLVVFVNASNTIVDNGITGGGLTWVQIFSNTPNGTRVQACYYAQVGASPASTTITWDCTGDIAAGCAMICYQITGHNASNQIAQSATAQNITGANPVVTLGANMNTNNAYMYFLTGSNNPPSSTPPASWTESTDTGYATPATGITAGFRVNGESGNTVTLTAASSSYDMSVVEINDSSQPPASSIKKMTLLGVG